MGVDIAEDMIRRARELDPGGVYRLVDGGGLGRLEAAAYDLVLSVFTFDDIPTMGDKVGAMRGIGARLKPEGVVVNLVSAPEIYTNEWASFSTKDFPGNRSAASGDKVLIVMLDVDDGRPVEDILWADDAYGETYRRAGLQAVEVVKPLADGTEPYGWVSETEVAPWVVYVLRPDA